MTRSTSFLKRLAIFIGAAVLTILPAGVTRAEEFTIDSAHSYVGFQIRHFVSQVKGSFTEYEGKVSYDAKKPEASKVDVTVKTASINTGVAKRDDHLRTPDFFDATKFPTMTYKSSSVKAAGADKLQVDGTLTMHGVSKPVTLDVTVHGTAKDPWGGTRAGFNAKGKINRKDFGMEYNKVLDTGGLMLGEEVLIDIEIEAEAKKK